MGTYMLRERQTERGRQGDGGRAEGLSTIWAMQWGDRLCKRALAPGVQHDDGQGITDVMSLAGTKTMAHKCYKAKGGATLRRGLPAVSGML
jgi:hypothetical protein